MEQNEKHSFLRGIDRAAEEKGSGAKTLWQLVKFLGIGLIVTGIQLALVNLLFFAMRDWKAPLPGFLAAVFSERTVGEGHDNWGYVLPFFLGNLIGNIYAYLQNRRTTFRSDAPWWCFAAYLGLIIVLVLFCTWLQGVIANALIATGRPFLSGFAPTAAACLCATLQTVILFPMEKFVLLKERKRPEERS